MTTLHNTRFRGASLARPHHWPRPSPTCDPASSFSRFSVGPSAAPAALAAGASIGGVDDSPAFLAETRRLLLHFSASGLAPSTSYFLKIRSRSVRHQPDRRTRLGPTTPLKCPRSRSAITRPSPRVTSDAAGTIDGRRVTAGSRSAIKESGDPLPRLTAETAPRHAEHHDIAIVMARRVANAGMWVHNARYRSRSGSSCQSVNSADRTTCSPSTRSPTPSMTIGDGTSTMKTAARCRGHGRLPSPCSGAAVFGPGSGVRAGRRARVQAAHGPMSTWRFGVRRHHPPTTPTAIRAAPGSGHVDLSTAAAADSRRLRPGRPAVRVYRWTPGTIGLEQLTPVRSSAWPTSDGPARMTSFAIRHFTH